MFFTIVLSLVFVFYLYFKWKYDYWRRRKLPYIPPRIPFGNVKNALTVNTSNGQQIRVLYDKFKAQGQKHAGIYILNRPVYFPIDPEFVKNVLSRDFQHFVDKDFYINEKDQPMSAHLFFIGGKKWKTLRTKLTPTFTSGKMRMMFATLVECRKPLLAALVKCQEEKIPVDVKDFAARFTTDIIGSVAFGINCNSFDEPDAEFRKYGKEIFHNDPIRVLKAMFQFAFKDFSRTIGLVPIKPSVSEFLTKVVRDTIDYRVQNKIERNDFLNLLIGMLSENGPKEDKITFDELTAQAFVFFAAGFETSSTTTTFCMFELALNQDIQDKVREEIRTVLKKHNDEITYEALAEMTYLKCVIDETLRKYPPLPTIDRKCTIDYPVPDTDVVIEKGTTVIISSLGLHRDPDYFPDPDKFDPERFSDSNYIKPFTYIPFGEGPRICIGLRFGMMQTKIGLITLLKDFRYKLNPKTNPKVEIDLGFILTAKGDILLDIERIA